MVSHNNLSIQFSANTRHIVETKEPVMQEIVAARLRLLVLVPTQLLHDPVGKNFISRLPINKHKLLRDQLSFNQTDSLTTLFTRFMVLLYSRVTDHNQALTSSEYAARLDQMIKANTHKLGSLVDQLRNVCCIFRRHFRPKLKSCPLDQCGYCKTTSPWKFPRER